MTIAALRHEPLVTAALPSVSGCSTGLVRTAFSRFLVPERHFSRSANLSHEAAISSQSERTAFRCDQVGR